MTDQNTARNQRNGFDDDDDDDDGKRQQFIAAYTMQYLHDFAQTRHVPWSAGVSADVVFWVVVDGVQVLCVDMDRVAAGLDCCAGGGTKFKGVYEGNSRGGRRKVRGAHHHHYRHHHYYHHHRHQYPH